jgi:hypothetical protein
MAPTSACDPEHKIRYTRWSWITSTRALVLIVLVGIFTGIVANRMQHNNPVLVRSIHNGFVTLVGLLLAFSLIPVALSFRVYLRYGKASPLISAFGGTLLVLGMFLNQLYPDDSSVAVAVYVLYAVSSVIFIRGIVSSKREIARLEALLHRSEG